MRMEIHDFELMENIEEKLELSLDLQKMHKPDHKQLKQGLFFLIDDKLSIVSTKKKFFFH